MSRRRRVAARAAAVAAAVALGLLSAGAGSSVRAQSITITRSATVGDSISPAPVITVTAEQVPADAQPASITLVASLEPQFRTPFFARSRPGVIAQFQLDSLLPQRTVVYMRAQVLDRFGVVRAERVDTSRVRSWLKLVSPARKTDVLFTRQPTFVWDSPAITLPPGPWTYRITIFNTGQGKVEEARSTNNTSFTFDKQLDACTSYKWSVAARATNGGPNDSTMVASTGTFVIQSAECPQVTISYLPFPNPFGRGTLSDKTCFWFDLAHRSTVKLTIYDIRLHEVKRLVPGDLPAVLDSGAYGRQAPTEQSGCDPRLAWDGRDDAGRFVPAGAYIAVFEADGKRETKKFLFKGQ